MQFVLLSIVVAAALILSGPKADAAESFYHDQTIRILTAAAGGSYDAYARLVARHLPNHIEGGVRAVVVQNMPGATIKIPLYLKDVATNDGTVVGSLNNAVAFAPLLDVPQADFDPSKFNWLGSPSTEIGLVVVWHTVPMATFKDPAFEAEARRQHFDVDQAPKTGADLKAIVAGVYGASKELRDRLVKLYKQDAN